ncbi:MAG: hypothetical protein ACK5B9_03485 [Flavobacteriia bacterium]|jgi:arabinofuranosyltransferase
MKVNGLKFILISLYTFVFSLISWFTNVKSLSGIDDANIYFIYMRNLANGNGFCYNIGGEKVEGFTSLLWTLIGSFCFKLTENPEIFLLILNFILVNYTLWKIVCFIDNLIASRKLISSQSLLFLGLLAVFPGFFEWTILSLMESALFFSILSLTSLQILEYILFDKKINYSFSILLGLLLLTRPESILWVPFFIFCNFFISLNKGNSIKSAITSLIFPFFLSSLVLASITIWRLNYFGYPFPNTYYAKVSDDLLFNLKNGSIYILECMSNYPVLLLSPILLIFLLFKKKKQFLPIVFLLLFCLTSIAIPTINGGDHFQYARFLQVGMPIFILAIIFFLYFTNYKLNFLKVFLIVALGVISSRFLILKNIYHQTSPLANEWEIAIEGRKNAKNLNTFFQDIKRLPVQGVYTAGGSAFFYKGETIDLLGLNNSKIAHSKKNKFAPKNHAAFNKKIFYEMHPDIFWLAGNTFKPKEVKTEIFMHINPFAEKVFQKIEKNSKFKKEYACGVLSKKNHPVVILAFFSKKFLSSLDSNRFQFKQVDIK